MCENNLAVCDKNDKSGPFPEGFSQCAAKTDLICGSSRIQTN